MYLQINAIREKREREREREGAGRLVARDILFRKKYGRVNIQFSFFNMLIDQLYVSQTTLFDLLICLLYSRCIAIILYAVHCFIDICIYIITFNLIYP